MDQTQVNDSDHESIGHAILASMRLNAKVQWEPELVRSDFTLWGHSLSVSRLSVKGKENISEIILVLVKVLLCREMFTDLTSNSQKSWHALQPWK